MILENYRQTTDYKPQTLKETAKQNNHFDKEEREFLMLKKTIKQYSTIVSPNRFDACEWQQMITKKNQASN